MPSLLGVKYKDKDRIIVLQNIEEGYLFVLILSVSDYALSVWHVLFASHLIYDTRA